MEIPRRLAVVVMGMHRSGTSAVAGTAVRLGLAAPRTMLPASPDNPAGFYESTEVILHNQFVLHTARCTWVDCLPFDPSRFDDATRSALAERSFGVLREEFAGAAAFMVKDPRLCLTLPVWLPALRAIGAAVAVLLVIRHPREVVHSLLQRDRLPEPALAPLWLHYTLAAERNSRGLPRAVVFYDDLLRDWRLCMACAGREAGIAWPLGIGPLGIGPLGIGPVGIGPAGSGPVGLAQYRADIDAFLAPSYWHHVAPEGPVSVGRHQVRDMIGATWSALRDLRDNPKSSVARERLDQVHGAFAAWRATELESWRDQFRRA